MVGGVQEAAWWPDEIEPGVIWVDFWSWRPPAWRQEFAECAGLRPILRVPGLYTYKYAITDGESVIDKAALPNPVGPWPRSGDAPGRIVPKEVVVQFFAGIPSDEWLGEFERAHGLRETSRIVAIEWFGFDITDGSSVLDKVAELAALPEVEHAIPNIYSEPLVIGSG